VPFIVAGAFAAAFGFSAAGGWPDHSEIPSRGRTRGVYQTAQEQLDGRPCGGAFDGGYLRLADELGKVVDDGDQLRVIPAITYGAAGNLQDRLYPALPLPGAFWRAT